MILYKYTDIKTALIILKNLKFRYTQPIAFNDPFEVSPIAERDIEDGFIKENVEYIVSSPNHMNFVYEKTMRELYDKLSSSQKLKITFENYKKVQLPRLVNEINNYNESIPKVIFDRIKVLNPDFTDDFFNNLPEAIGSSTGVLCMSKSSDNILMWSHYANSHLGVILEIDTNNNFFANLNEVKYDLKRPSLDVNKDPINDDEKIKYAMDVFFTKSKSWKYEKEFRDIKRIADGENTHHIDQRGFPIVLFEFPKSIIKGIIFGSKIKKEEKTEYVSFIRDLGFNIKFKEALLHKSLFKIKINLLR